MKRPARTIMAVALGVMPLTTMQAQAQVVLPALESIGSLVGGIFHGNGKQKIEKMDDGKARRAIRRQEKRQRKMLDAGNSRQSRVHFLPADSTKY